MAQVVKHLETIPSNNNKKKKTDQHKQGAKFNEYMENL
jgi:hypothetical protein